MNLPPLALLDPHPAPPPLAVPDDGDTIVRTLGQHNIEVVDAWAHVGPQAVRYDLLLAAGILPVKVERAIEAVALATGRTVRYGGVHGTRVSVEVARTERASVPLRAAIEASPALVSLGFVAGQTFDSFATGRIVDAPHLLVAGTTGGGKSTFLTQLLATLLLRNTPGDMRLMLIDPKRVELTAFAGLPHLLEPIVTEPESAVRALRRVLSIMDQRYKTFGRLGVKDLRGHNDLPGEKLPRIVVVIDELADLMMTSPKSVEEHLVRLGQLGRAAGVHIVAATQRPDAKTITTKIKTNIPGRVVFHVSSHYDSQVALDATGAEKLLGAGDGLLKLPGLREPVRFQSPAASADEVDRVVSWWAQNSPPAPTTPQRDEEAAARAEAERQAAEDARVRREYSRGAREMFPEYDTPVDDVLAEAGISEDVVDALAEKVAERVLAMIERMMPGEPGPSDAQ